MTAYNSNEKYSYPSICQYCGQKVIRYGSNNGAKVVLNPYDLGMEGPHYYTCTRHNPYNPQRIKKLKKFTEDIFKEESANNIFIQI